MSGPLLWWLNLDAELELSGRGSRGPRSEVLRRARSVEALWRRAGREHDLFVCSGAEPSPALVRAHGVQGVRAWCPTDEARARLKRLLGAERCTLVAPPGEVLRRVSDRFFHRALVAGLPGSGPLHDEAQWCRLQRKGEGPWLLSRRFGFSGRERLRVELGRPLPEPWQRWIQRSFELGGLWADPFVERTADFSRHALLGPRGELRVGRACVHEVDDRGHWRAARPARQGELHPAEDRALEAALHEAGRALVAAGYFGPFGIDAFRWRGPDGASHFHPLCDLNARYTMAWPLGMAGVDPDFPVDPENERRQDRDRGPAVLEDPEGFDPRVDLSPPPSP